MTTLVYLDSAEIHPYAQTNDELALHAVRIDGTWNGWEIPVVTAAEFRRFIAANANNDPNGSWLASGVFEYTDTHSMVYDDGVHDEPDVWAFVGYDDDGNALYALDGWVWTL